MISSSSDDTGVGGGRWGKLAVLGKEYIGEYHESAPTALLLSTTAEPKWKQTLNTMQEMDSASCDTP